MMSIFDWLKPKSSKNPTTPVSDRSGFTKQLIARLYSTCVANEEPDGGPSNLKEPPPENITTSVYFLGTDSNPLELAERFGAKLARQKICEELMQVGKGNEDIIAHAMFYSPYFRMRANLAMVLGSLGTQAAFDALKKITEIDNNENVMRNALKSLVRYKAFGAREVMANLKRRLPRTVVAQMAEDVITLIDTNPDAVDAYWTKY